MSRPVENTPSPTLAASSTLGSTPEPSPPPPPPQGLRTKTSLLKLNSRTQLVQRDTLRAVYTRGISRDHGPVNSLQSGVRLLPWKHISPRPNKDSQEMASASRAKRVRLDTSHVHIPSGYRGLSYGNDMATTVEIRVGINSELFILHLSALCDVSPFFRNTFLGDFKEAREKRMELPVTDTNTFKMFVEWLYSRKLLLDPVNEELARVRKLPDLAFLYVFADNYDVPQLERDTMDAIISCVQKDHPLLDSAVIRYVYDNLPGNSPLCRLLVNECARTGQELAGGPDHWPGRFMFEAFNAITRAQHSPLVRPAHDCTYHKHSTEEEESACINR